MNVEFFKRYEFFTGVPDSRLAPLCSMLSAEYSPKNHITAANEGNAAAIAAGYYLSSGKIPAVYLQNSGIGNIVNPVLSLLSERVYRIPCVFVVGWRGEPGIPDEPQHAAQGEVTVKLLEDIGIKTFIIDKSTKSYELQAAADKFDKYLKDGKCVAYIVRAGALEYEKEAKKEKGYSLLREDIIRTVTEVRRDAVIISTTGKTSRELYEIREREKSGHANDFLTVGSMGHCSSIALSVALNKPGGDIICIDGDGAALMHMGALAVIGERKPKNLTHILINNAAHESVGSMPTPTRSLDFVKLAFACGYPRAVLCETLEELKKELSATQKELTFIEVKAKTGSRPDLGRPGETPCENKTSFMERLEELR